MTTLMTRENSTASQQFSSQEKTTAATATIASLSDQEWYISRTYGIFRIPAKPKDAPYSLVLIAPRGDALDLGDNRRFPFSISAREIAQDIVQDLDVHGVFVCAADLPAEAELAAAAAKREEWYKQLVFDADQEWARSHNYREISDHQRRAALALGLEREWAYVPQNRLVDCPVCGEKIKPGIAVCRHCNAVLDETKAAQHGLGAKPTPKLPPAPGGETSAKHDEAAATRRQAR